MKPKYRDNWKCPNCGKDAVALELPNFSSNVTWCSAGHVTVWNNQALLRSKLVYDFNEEEDI